MYYLYARGTFEEEVIRVLRAKNPAFGSDLSDANDAIGASKTAQSTEGSVVSLLRDSVMREFVANPRYVEAAHEGRTKAEPQANESGLHFGLFIPFGSSVDGHDAQCNKGIFESAAERPSVHRSSLFPSCVSRRSHDDV